MRLPIEEQHEVNKIRNSVHANPERLRNYVARMVENWPEKYPAAVSNVRLNAAGMLALPATTSAPRVPLLDSAVAPRASSQFIAAAQQLLGGLPNSICVWAHTPHVAKFFVPFFFAFERDGAGSILPAPLRLMVLLKTHHLHNAHYLLAHHTVLGRSAGLTSEQLAALSEAREDQSPEFTPRERAAIAWAAQVAHNVAKRDETVFNELTRHFSEAEVVELTGLCAICSNADLVYNALRVPLEPASKVASLNNEVAIDATRIKVYLQTVLADWPQEWPQLDLGVAL
ncbi:MAG: carboxymuconolactone decarboxylase family protein [Burkholderiales bacterium]